MFLKKISFSGKSIAIFIFILVTAVLLKPITAPAAEVAKQEKIIFSLSDGATLAKGTMYTMDPDGTNQVKLFDFSNHPKDTSGRMREIRVNEQGTSIFFTSQNAMHYGPARANLFSISAGGGDRNQITPGENSGLWGSGTGTVTGTVKKTSGGLPWSGVPVFLEGAGMVYTDANGGFTFHDVPAGQFWLNGYRGGGSDVHDSQYITITPGSTTGPWNLVPNTGSRWSVENPVPYGEKIYYIFSYYNNLEIKRTDTRGTIPNDTILTTTTGSCGGEFDAFDIGEKTGKMVILKYDTGCGGVYAADKNGQNMQGLVNLASTWYDDSPGDTQEIFWNPDETFFALKGKLTNPYTYVSNDTVLVFDAGGNYKGEFPVNPGTSLTLHGWSPDGKWLLISAHFGDPTKVTLAKAKVNTDGSVDPNAPDLLTNVNLSGAAWTNLAPGTTFSWNLFLPAILQSPK